MEFRVLGPVEAYDGDASLPLGGTKQRALLGYLLIHRNEVVPVDTLVDLLWGETPPETAQTALYGLVSNLRKLLEPEIGSASASRVLVTQAPGYVLRLGADQVDLDSFQSLLKSGSRALADGDPSTAARQLTQALALWRGPALADVRDIPLLRPAVIELEELRRVALEDRIEADLALGRAAEVVGELETLVGKEPLRERPRAQLMLALYRSGRHADALDVYQRTRAMLVDELGIEPSGSLQELQRSILRQDPGLDLSVPKDIVRDGAISAKVETEALASRPRRPSVRLVIVAAGGRCDRCGRRRRLHRK